MHDLIGVAVLMALNCGIAPAAPLVHEPDAAATAAAHTPGAVPGPADAWLGGDKFQHIGMSFAMTVFVFAAVRAAGADTDGALVAAVPVAAAAGLGKELLDRRRGGPFSVRDLIADALGLGAAFLLLREVR